MRGTILYGARDVRFEDLPEPKVVAPTDAVIRLSATCICGSDLWPYRGSSRSGSRRRWVTSTAALSRRSEVRMLSSGIAFWLNSARPRLS
jgi:hypothetical protein